MKPTRRPLIANRDAALYLGLALWAAGTLMLWDAWDNRGKPKPFVFKLAGAAL